MFVFIYGRFCIDMHIISPNFPVVPHEMCVALAKFLLPDRQIDSFQVQVSVI